jgi:hypothetical protein
VSWWAPVGLSGEDFWLSGSAGAERRRWEGVRSGSNGRALNEERSRSDCSKTSVAALGRWRTNRDVGVWDPDRQILWTDFRNEDGSLLRMSLDRVPMDLEIKSPLDIRAEAEAAAKGADRVGVRAAARAPRRDRLDCPQVGYGSRFALSTAFKLARAQPSNAAPRRLPGRRTRNCDSSGERMRSAGSEGPHHRVRELPRVWEDVQAAARVNVTCVTPLGEEVASTS